MCRDAWMRGMRFRRFGPLAAIFVQEHVNMHANCYTGLMTTYYILDVLSWLPDGNKISQQDNAPRNRTKFTRDFTEEQHNDMLVWLARSPDLAPPCKQTHNREPPSGWRLSSCQYSSQHRESPDSLSNTNGPNTVFETCIEGGILRPDTTAWRLYPGSSFCQSWASSKKGKTFSKWALIKKKRFCVLVLSNLESTRRSIQKVLRTLEFAPGCDSTEDLNLLGFSLFVEIAQNRGNVACKFEWTLCPSFLRTSRANTHSRLPLDCFFVTQIVHSGPWALVVSSPPQSGGKAQLVKKSTPNLTAKCSSRNSPIEINFARRTMAKEWVVQRLLCVLRSNDWYPAPTGMIRLAHCVRVVVVERGRVWGVDEVVQVL